MGYGRGGCGRLRRPVGHSVAIGVPANKEQERTSLGLRITRTDCAPCRGRETRRATLSSGQLTLTACRSADGIQRIASWCGTPRQARVFLPASEASGRMLAGVRPGAGLAARLVVRQAVDRGRGEGCGRLRRPVGHFAAAGVPASWVGESASACRLLEPAARLAGAGSSGVAIILDMPADAAGVPICPRILQILPDVGAMAVFPACHLLCRRLRRYSPYRGYG